MASYELLGLVNLFLREIAQDAVATVASSTDKLVLHLIDQANLLSYEIANAANWDWLYDTSNFTTVINQQEYSASNNKLASNAEYYWGFRQMKTPIRLTKKSKEWLDNTYPNYTDSTGDPLHWIPVGWQKIWLDPIPKSVMTVNYGFKKFITQMSADDDEPDIPEPYQYILIQGMRWKGFEYMTKEGRGTYNAEKEERRYYGMLAKSVDDLTADPPDHSSQVAGWDYY